MTTVAFLELSTGDRLQGHLIGAPLNTSGEMVFTTAMVGYSESLTDPSYFGQILVFAYPLIGNYGIPKQPKASLAQELPEGYESSSIHASGVILTSDTKDISHWTGHHNLDHWLKHHHVPGLVGIDTRHLVTIIRSHGHVFGKITTAQTTDYRQLGSIQLSSQAPYFDPNKRLITTEVSTPTRQRLGKGNKRIAVYDYGIKWNILRQLLTQYCEVELLPWNTDPDTVDCDAWLLSNGPGNPTTLTQAVTHIRQLLTQERPILGICLGHQLLALAAGARIEHMPYGHRSHNQPVTIAGSKKGYITCQNHSYMVDKHHLPPDWQVWFHNLNDQTVEGIKHASKPFCSVQFHPEAAGGPRDTAWILSQFISQTPSQ